ncbi:MAG: oligosaccharide flippase family protein [Elusimicrobiales bacterium]
MLFSCDHDAHRHYLNSTNQSLSQKICRNTFFNAIGRLWGILVALVLTPYIIRHIGVERYGIWALVGVITGYFGLLDFGVGTSFVKYIAEFYAKRDYEKINQVVNTGFVFYTVFAILIIVLGFLFINPLLSFFKIPPQMLNEVRFVFLLGIIIFGVSNALSPFLAVQTGLQRMDITNKISIAVSIPTVLGTVFFLEKGYGLPGLMVNNAIVLVITGMCNIVVAFKILPELRFNPFSISKGMFKVLWIFGFKVRIGQIAGTMVTQVDKLLISHFLSTNLVTFYQLGSSIVEKAQSIPTLLLTALLPAFSEISTKGDRQKLLDAYLRGTKYLALITFPLFVFLIVSASHIMMIWMGEGYEKSARVIQILAVGTIFHILVGVGYSVSLAIDKPEISMSSSLLYTVLNFVLSIVLILKFGFIGAVWGTTISLLIGCGYFFWRLHKEIHLSLVNFVKKTILIPMIICISIGLPIAGLNPILQNFLGSLNSIKSLAIFIVQGIVFISLYLTILQCKKPFDKVDFDMFKKWNSSIQHLIVKWASKQ